jgi:hypothetical protein
MSGYNIFCKLSIATCPLCEEMLRDAAVSGVELIAHKSFFLRFMSKAVNKGLISRKYEDCSLLRHDAA